MWKRTVALLATAVTVGLMPLGVAEPAGAAPGDYEVQGIDVSHYQEAIDWPAVAGAGIDFAYAKATDGTAFVDDYYAGNRSGARSAGLFFGAYHYGRPNQGDPRGQADRFLDVAGYSADGRTLPPMLDIEWPNKVDPACYEQTPTQIVSWIAAFTDQVRVRTGRRPLIYTNPQWWNRCTGNSTAFGSDLLFHSTYADSPGALPAGWSDWEIWQYTSKGSVAGVSGKVDRDVFRGSLADLAALCGDTTPTPVRDFDGDGWSDHAVFRPSNGTWYLSGSQHGTQTTKVFGTNGDKPLSADVDGDHRADHLLFRPSNGTWYIWQSKTNSQATKVFGTAGDIPVVGYFDDDTLADYAVFRPSNGTWYLWQSKTNSQATKVFGTNGDIPAVGYYDDDALADYAVFRPSNGTWYVWQSTTNSQATKVFGTAGDIPAVGDYDGDRQTDHAVFRPSNGTWYVWQSKTNSQATKVFGTAGDIPAVGYYDHDTLADHAVFRPSTGTWYVWQSTTDSQATKAFGTNGDIPA